mmetsp:Transcript_58152/g.138405  ORF Transcript_58152/g.138405 Transcript_58152/m.138405 type:complete len:236 (-) Transcript_58152:593-1300(-)
MDSRCAHGVQDAASALEIAGLQVCLDHGVVGDNVSHLLFNCLVHELLCRLQAAILHTDVKESIVVAHGPQSKLLCDLEDLSCFLQSACGLEEAGVSIAAERHLSSWRVSDGPQCPACLLVTDTSRLDDRSAEHLRSCLHVLHLLHEERHLSRLCGQLSNLLHEGSWSGGCGLLLPHRLEVAQMLHSSLGVTPLQCQSQRQQGDAVGLNASSFNLGQKSTSFGKLVVLLQRPQQCL